MLPLILTGFKRWQLIRHWHKIGKPGGDKEDFVKKVCNQKGMVYMPPPEKARRMV